MTLWKQPYIFCVHFFLRQIINLLWRRWWHILALFHNHSFPLLFLPLFLFPLIEIGPHIELVASQKQIIKMLVIRHVRAVILAHRILDLSRSLYMLFKLLLRQFQVGTPPH